MASMRDIKRRKDSIQSTGQITKAMKLVSTVKLQKARGRAESAKPFFQATYETVSMIMKHSGKATDGILKNNPEGKKAVIVVTSNRGLAGGYNSNIVKTVLAQNWNPEEVLIYAVGHKGMDALVRNGYTIAADYSEVINAPLYSDAMTISKELLTGYKNGEIGEIYLAYTAFKNTVVHEPKLLQLLPVDEDAFSDSKEEEKAVPMNFEPEAEEVMDLIIPKYLNSLLFGAFTEAVASENGARMQAMDSATSNAEEMISDLSLKYNRARQGSITQELTEIIGGAEALS
jgi:F-type H+-transporting ATPase subunit gamma